MLPNITHKNTYNLQRRNTSTDQSRFFFSQNKINVKYKYSGNIDTAKTVGE